MRPTVTDVLVSIGGGGLIAGVATAFRALAPHVRVWGVETDGRGRDAPGAGGGRPVPTPLLLDRHHAVRAAVSDLTWSTRRELLAGRARGVGRRGRRGHGRAGRAREGVDRARGGLPGARGAPGAGTGRRPGHLGLVVCGGNATFADIARWSSA